MKLSKRIREINKIVLIDIIILGVLIPYLLFVRDIRFVILPVFTLLLLLAIANHLEIVSSQNSDQQEEGSSKNKFWFWFTGVIVLVLLIGLFLFAFFPRSNNYLRKLYFPNQAFVETKLLVNENFNSPMDDNIWLSECANHNIRYVNGELEIIMKQNENDEWESCKFVPIIKSNLIRKISLSAFINSESNDKGWLGIYSSCGGQYLNFMMNTEGVLIDHEDLGRITLEKFENPYSSHNERMLEIEYRIDKWVFSAYKGGFSNVITREINCKDGLTYIAIGSGTNPGGLITGSIDNVEIWVIED